MLVTVAICTWNRSASLARTLQQFTLLEIPRRAEWEILVVNNNSTDQTDRVVASYLEGLPVRVLNEPVAGKSRACNRAIREARGELVLWTDDDVLVDRRWLSATVDAFTRWQADWVFGPSDPIWPVGSPSWYVEELRPSFSVLNYGSREFQVTNRNTPFYGLNFAGSLAAHQAVGGFRENIGMKRDGGGVGEDIELFRRALSAGMRIVYTPNAKVGHMIAADRLTKRYHRRRQWRARHDNYAVLPELFPGLPEVFGIPRFIYRKGLSDVWEAVKNRVLAREGRSFRHELQAIRVAGMITEGVRAALRNSQATYESNHPGRRSRLSPFRGDCPQAEADGRYRR